VKEIARKRARQANRLPHQLSVRPGSKRRREESRRGTHECMRHGFS
jgi:hypothetical protein